MPENSTQITTPWLALYLGLTLLLTLGTIFWFRKASTVDLEVVKRSLQEDLDKNSEATLFPGLSFARSSSSVGTTSVGTNDLEKGVLH
jgi:hypothetical protein